MPLIQVGSDGWKWGKSGKVYRGKGAREKSLKQMKAIKVSQNISKQQHSRDKCMRCSQSPTIEFLWAEGMGHCWYCDKHEKEFRNGDGHNEICAERKLKYHVASDRWRDGPVTKTAAEKYLKSHGKQLGENNQMQMQTLRKSLVNHLDLIIKSLDVVPEDVLMKSFDGKMPDVMKQDANKPSQSWWDACTSRASEFADDSGRYCAALWAHEQINNWSGDDVEQIGKMVDPKKKVEDFGGESEIRDGTHMETSSLKPAKHDEEN